MRRIVIGLLAAGVLCVGASACGETSNSSGSGSGCMVLEQGNTVCGATAAAWCQLTSPQRQQAIASGVDVTQLQQTAATCGLIESDNP